MAFVRRVRKLFSVRKEPVSISPRGDLSLAKAKSLSSVCACARGDLRKGEHAEQEQVGENEEK